MNDQKINWSNLDLIVGFKLSAESGLAWQMLKTHPLITAIPDGEDSSGRQKTRNMGPEETVDRAFAMAKRFIAEARKDGGPECPDAIGIARQRGVLRRTEWEKESSES